MSFPPGFFQKKKKKKVLTFKRWRHPRCLPPSGPPPMVEKYAQREREVVFCDEKLLIRPYSQFR